MSVAVEKAYATDTCKIGQGAACCRYLVVGSLGLECAKLTPLRDVLDARVGQMSAKGDNCDGRS